MASQERVSSLQLGIMIFYSIVATALLSVPNITGYFARNDMWLSTIWASAAGFITFFILWRLSILFPQMSLIQAAESILGSFGGKLIGWLYILYFLQISGIIVRSYAEFLIGSFLPRTPLVMVTGSILIVCAYAIREGIEVIGRAAQVVTPFFLLSLLLIPLLGKDMNFANIFPIMGEGIMPSIKGAMSPQAWFSEIILLSFLLPYLQDKKNTVRIGLITTLCIMTFLTILNLFVLFVFGHHLEDMVYPVMVAFRYIRIADFLENLESLIMSLWVISAFIKIAVFYYVTTLTISQTFHLRSYQPVVLPVGLLLAVFSAWSLPNQSEVFHFDQFVFPFLGFFMQTLLPFVLLSLAWFKATGKVRSGSYDASKQGG